MDGEATPHGSDEYEPPKALTILITILVVFITTRFVSGGSSTLSNGFKTPRLAPYWVPRLGHLPQALLNVQGLLSRLRNRYNEGLFSIRLLGSIHTIVFRQDLFEELLSQPSSAADQQWVVRHLMLSNFGLRKKDLAAYEQAAPEIQALNRQHLSGSGLDELTKATMAQLKTSAADWVTFNSFPVDQMEWERVAEAELIEDNGKGEQVVAVNLLELTRNFVAKTANAALFGTNFVDNFPDISRLLWVFDEGFVSLAMNIPIWFPSRATQRGRSTLKQLLGNLREFHEAMEKEMNDEEQDPKWEDLANASQFVKSRAQVYRKHGLSLEARAAYDLSLLWSLNANSTPIIYWTLSELYQDPVLLDFVHDEISPHVKIVQPENPFGLAVWMAPKVEKLDLDGLINHCPVLKAAYTESVRLYGGGWSTRYLQEDVKLGGKDGEDTFVLKKGTFAHVVQDLWHNDPNSFPDTKEWLPGRYVDEAEDGDGRVTRSYMDGPVKPYNGDLTMCDDSAFAMRKVLAYMAVIIASYDIEPAKGNRWSMPNVMDAAVSKYPFWPATVWIKRKELGQKKQEA